MSPCLATGNMDEVVTEMAAISPEGAGVLADPETLEVTRVVRDRIAANRARGLGHAYRVVAREFDITPRRARGYWLREIRTASAAEWRRIMGAATEWLERDAARLEAEAAILRVRLAASSSGGAERGSRSGGCGGGWDRTERRGRGVSDRAAILMAVEAWSVEA